MGDLIYLRDVVTLELAEEKCVGCGMCLTVCPHAVFTMYGNDAHIDNRDACMECGACARNCPAEAITVKTGVGCAAAVINAALGRKNSACCCVVDDNALSAGEQCSTGTSKKMGCC